jgi:predicted nucleic acid-binding protein
VITIVDTGVLVALLNGKDVWHERCSQWFTQASLDDLLIPPLVIAETGFLTAASMGPETEAGFLADLSEGLYGTVADMLAEDLARMSELVRQYADFDLGSTDASVIALAERFGTPLLATIDERHMRCVVPRHAAAFTLVVQDL